MIYIKLTKDLIHPYSQQALFFAGDILTPKAVRAWFTLTGCDYIPECDYISLGGKVPQAIKSDTLIRIVTTHINTMHHFNV